MKILEETANGEWLRSCDGSGAVWSGGKGATISRSGLTAVPKRRDEASAKGALAKGRKMEEAEGGGSRISSTSRAQYGE
jgi:hypothetical protein